MPTLDGGLARLRPLTLAFVGLALGAGLGTTLQSVQAQAVTTYTRAFSCQGRDFMPLSDSQHFGFYGAARTGGSPTAGYYQCPADLPHKAVVTRVRFTLHDTAQDATVKECALSRTSLIASDAGDTGVLALLPATGISAMPGDVRVSTSSIAYPTVDRLNHAYYLSCWIEATGDPSATGIWGADVTYTITAANG